MKPLDPRLLRYARSTRAYLALSVVLGAALAGLLIAQATLLANAITAIYLHHASLAGQTRTIAWLAVVLVARAGVAWGQEMAATRAAAAVKSQLRRRLLTHVAALGPAWLGTRRTGEIATLATRGLDALDAYFARYLPQLVLAALVPAIVLARILPADTVAGVTIAVTLPLIPLFMALIGWQTEATNRRQFRLLARLSHHFLDVVAGLTTLKAFGRAAAQAGIIRRISGEQRRVTMRTLRVAFLSSLVLELLATLSVALVAVGIGLRLVNGHLDLATALLVLILAPEAYLPIRQVGANFHASAEGLAAAEEVFAILAVPPPSGSGAPAAAPTVVEPVVASDPAAVELRFECVDVRYPDRTEPALHAFSATVQPGEVVALTGHSGCGKSTALAVLLGFVAPTTGRVVVGGRDLAEMDIEAWRRGIAWVPQHPRLFAATIADNIHMGDPSADVSAMRRAARDAGAEEFIDALPDGYATVLADDGVGLSAGQRQRVALARAFLRNAQLVLLDEPTANLDAQTEAGVLAAVRRLAQGRTVVIAAHRPTLVALAHREIAIGRQPVSVVSGTVET